MKIADDFDAIRQRAREIAEEKHPMRAVDLVAGESIVSGPVTFVSAPVDTEADVSSNFFGGPFFGGMIVA